MLGLNVFSLLVFAALNIFAAMLCRCSNETRCRILRAVCIALFVFSLCRYVLAFIGGRGLVFPVEYSSVAYFAVPIILLTRIKRAQSWAAYSGIVAGFFYYMTLIIAGGRVYAAYPPYDIYISVYCHGSLYLCGLVSLKTNKYALSDRFILLSGNVCVALNAYVLRPIAEGKTRIFIYELMDGMFVKQAFPSVLWNYVMPAYYILMAGCILLSVSLFFRLNKMYHDKNSRANRESNSVLTAIKTHM